MKRQGFTLVELLAVVAVLAILVILALPNVLGLFTSSKESAFVTEAQNVYRVAGEEWVMDSMNSGGPVEYSSRGNQLINLSKSTLGYYVRLDSSGNILHLIVYDTAYQIVAGDEENTNPISINDLCVSSSNCKYRVVQRTAYIMFPGSLSSNKYILGDVDRDGLVGEDDLIILSDYIAGNTDLDITRLFSADVNSDGIVDNKDYEELEKYIEHLPSVLDNVVTYTVEHYKQNIELSGYDLFETDETQGILNQISRPVTKEYEGFNTPEIKNVTISSSGIKVKYYYSRKSYTVALSEGNGISDVLGSGTYPYEKVVVIEAVPFEGYTFEKWSGSQTINNSSVTISITHDVNLTASAYLTPPTCNDCVYKTDGTNWELALLSSGSVTFPRNESIDIFLVGAGGSSSVPGARDCNYYSNESGYEICAGWYVYQGQGGSGGGISTYKNINVTKNSSSPYTIGTSNLDESKISVSDRTYISSTYHRSGGYEAYLNCWYQSYYCGPNCTSTTTQCIPTTRSHAQYVGNNTYVYDGCGGNGVEGEYAFGDANSLYNPGVRYGSGGDGYYHIINDRYGGCSEVVAAVQPNTGHGGNGAPTARPGSSGVIIIRNHR